MKVIKPVAKPTRHLVMQMQIYFFLSTSPQGQGHHNSVSQLLWARIFYPTLSTFPVGGNRRTRRKPTTFGRALTILFSHEDWLRVYLTEDRTQNLRGEKGEWSDHYTTEAPVFIVRIGNQFLKK